MTGPECFKLAEDYAHDAARIAAEHGDSNPVLAHSGVAALAAIAQAYATLAQTAATIDAVGYTADAPARADEWREVLS